MDGDARPGRRVDREGPGGRWASRSPPGADRALPECPLATTLAAELRAARERLVGRWLERIERRVRIEKGRIFPSEDLLDHVPILIDGIADYVEHPAEEITADVPVVAKAMELGEMRHDQDFDAHEILKEYEILGGIMFAFLIRIVDEIDQPCTRSELLSCAHRLFRSIAVIQQVTVTTYLGKAHERINEREQRLRGFHRTLSHELKNRVGLLQNAARMLGEDFVIQDEAERGRFQSLAVENAGAMSRVIDNLSELARLDSDSRQRRNVRLPETVFEVVRQLRVFASARDVSVVVAEDLPAVEVPSSALELILSNYVSNAVKYHDPETQDRWVHVSGWVDGEGEARPCELVVEVKDNGRGVAPEHRGRLFDRFFRADPEGDAIEGSGLGLSIVRETAETIGGRVWAEFGDGCTAFYLALPSRRAIDQDA